VNKTISICLILVFLFCFNSFGGQYSIPEDEKNSQKIFYGATDSFDKPAEVDYEAVVKATSEYASIKSKRIKTGTAKYWILMSKASDHAVRVICEFAEESDYDLVVEKGYLESLTTPIPSENITNLIKKAIKKE